MKKTIITVTLILLSILLAPTIPIISNGFLMYQEATTDKPLDQVLETIQTDENYFSLTEVNQQFITSLLESEDHRFYSHDGIDIVALTRATIHNIEAMSFKEGGSTITQQLAKNLYFSFEKKLDRKVAELFVVAKLESNYTKDQILEIYLNIIYFGENCYGLKEAANHYFNKEPSQLNQNEIDALVYTIKSPNNYNPNKVIYSNRLH